MTQLGLFGGSGVGRYAAEAMLAARIPDWVRFGTSSWTFTDWAGLVYPEAITKRELLTTGLRHYASFPLFRTVGIDCAYYRPLTELQLQRYAEQLPVGFQCITKVHRELTTWPAGSTSGAFLSPSYFEQAVVAPTARAFAQHQGPLVLEFPPMPASFAMDPGDFALSLDRFLERASRRFPLAVELRNESLLTRRYRDVLNKHGVGHVVNYWEAMPSVERQARFCQTLRAPFQVVRLLIPPGMRYAARKKALSPFTTLRDPRPEMRRQLLQLLRTLRENCRAVFVLVNNKAEGCAPLTVLELAKAWVGPGAA